MSEAQLKYIPPGPVAARFLADRSRVCAIMGPVGSGKSTVCIFKMLFAAIQQPVGPISGLRRARWAVIRNTYPELRTTTIRSWHQWVPQNLGRWQSEGPPTHVVNFNVPGGPVELEVMFMALDSEEDVKKLLSLELSGAWINEAREVPMAVLDRLTERLPRFPPHNDGGVACPQIILDTNAPDIDSDFYRLFEETKPPGYMLYKQPSGRSAQAENLHNLAPDYYQAAAVNKTALDLRVYIDGLYGYSRDGKPVFPEFDDTVHVAGQELLPVRELPLIIGLDAGLTPAAVIKQRLPDGQWRALDELVAEQGAGIGPNRFGDMLNRLLRERYEGMKAVGWCDPSAAYGADNEAGESSWLETVANVTRIPIRAAPSNQLTLRLEAVRLPMAQLIDGRKPGYLLSPRCRVLRKAYNSGYKFKRLKLAGREAWHDLPDKNEFSHVADADQYAMLGGGELMEVMGRDKGRREHRRQQEAIPD